MTQNVLQAAGEAYQTVEGNADATSVPGARALLDHLHSTLGVSADEAADSPSRGEVALAAPSFSDAVVRQAEQIQSLVEHIHRNDAPPAQLQDVRELYSTLNDVALWMKQSASEAAAKIGLLTGAVTIISGAPNLDTPHDFATILDGAKAVAARMASLESVLHEAGAAIVALEGNASRSQNTVHDMSVGLAKLSAQVESDGNQIANLQQQLVSADQALAQAMASIRDTVLAVQNEIAGLDQRIAAADVASSEGLAALDERAAALRDELGQVHERLLSVEASTTLHAGFQEKIEVLNRDLEEAGHATAAEIEKLRLQGSEHFADLTNKLEALEYKNQILSQDTEQTMARLKDAEQTIEALTQRQKALSAWHTRITQVLSSGPDLSVE